MSATLFARAAAHAMCARYGKLLAHRRRVNAAKAEMDRVIANARTVYDQAVADSLARLREDQAAEAPRRPPLVRRWRRLRGGGLPAMEPSVPYQRSLDALLPKTGQGRAERRRRAHACVRNRVRHLLRQRRIARYEPRACTKGPLVESGPTDE